MSVLLLLAAAACAQGAPESLREAAESPAAAERSFDGSASAREGTEAAEPAPVPKPGAAAPSAAPRAFVRPGSLLTDEERASARSTGLWVGGLAGLGIGAFTAGCVIGGLWMVSPPAALVVGGLLGLLFLVIGLTQGPEIGESMAEDSKREELDRRGFSPSS